jgi:hypothetical protein
MTRPSIARVLPALVAAVLFQPVVRAQPVTMPTAVDDVFSIESSVSMERHSNVFGVPDGPSDSILRGLFGVRFDRNVSLQRFSVHASVEPTKFVDNSNFDFVGYRAGANWDWAVGRPLFGQLTARIARYQPSFYDQGFTLDGQDPTDDASGRNIQRVAFLRGLGAFRLTQSWSVFAAADRQSVDHDAVAQRPADTDVTGVEAGLRFSPGTGNEFDFFYRRAEGDYPNRQVLDEAGNPLGDAIDNAYTQDSLLSRITWRPNEALRVAGQAGWTRREFENLPQRNFRGPTVGLDVAWQVGGFTTLRLDLIRTIVSDDAITSSYVDVQTIAFRPTVRPTARISVEGLASTSRRAYEGDPGPALTGAEVRSDRINELGLRFNYEIARRVFSYAELRRVERTSNFARFEFTDDIVGVGLRGEF